MANTSNAEPDFWCDKKTTKDKTVKCYMGAPKFEISGKDLLGNKGLEKIIQPRAIIKPFKRKPGPKPKREYYWKKHRLKNGKILWLKFDKLSKSAPK